MIMFPDVEALIVAYLKSVLDSSIFVATKKPAPDAAQPDNQVIVTAAYTSTREKMLRTASLTLEIYALGHIEATNLALEVEAWMAECANEYIKRSTLLMSAVRLAEKSEMEKRAIDIELIIKGFEQ